MEQTNEARFSDALDAATEEAVSEVDAIEGDDDFLAEDVTDDEPVSEQESDDTEVEDVVEAADEGTTEVVEELEEVAQPTFEQTGNPEHLPPELLGSYKLMQAGYTKKSQEVAEMRRKYEEMNQQVQRNLEAQQKAVKAEARPPRPTNPIEGMSQEAIDQRYREINEYDSETTMLRMIESGQIPDPDKFKQQQEDTNVMAEANRRYQMVSSKDGYNENVENAMMHLVETSQYWNSAVKTDEGALACFDYVKTQLAANEYKTQAAELENARVKRSADAQKRATPKPTTQTKSVATKPADNFASLGFEDKIDSVIYAPDAFGS